VTPLIDIPGYTSGTWEIDLLHSDVSFVIRHVGLTRYRRSFEKFGGQIVTADNPLESSVSAFIDVTSFDTGLEKFNQHLLAEQFLDAENYPTATFRSTAIRPSDRRLALDGELTLRGVTRPTTLYVEVLGFGPGSKGETKAAFSASTTIDRSDFGITYDAKLGNGTLIVGKKVQILLEIEVVLVG
jgi:polyisoprenoid-binding protein YceI